MSDDVQYDGGGFVPDRENKQAGGLTALLIRGGFAKDERQANVVLWSLLVLAVIIGVGVWFI